jgi:hypothetical protein
MRTSIFVALVLLAVWTLGCSDSKDSDVDSGPDASGDTDADTDGGTDVDAGQDAGTDEDAGADSDTSGGALVDCAGGKLDQGTGLCWQEPPSTKWMGWDAAIANCADLDLAGHADWRLPSIDELRSLVRGCAATEPAGACGVTDDCLTASCSSDACYGCPAMAGPAGGCYWPGGLAGECGGFWSSSQHGGSALLAWGVSFGEGFVYEEDKEQALTSTRCVRDGA